MMKGTYRFYQNGVLVGESTNLITDEGKRHIFRYLAGQVPRLAGSIAVGTGGRPAGGSDRRLTYEVERATIYLTSPDYINKKIIFKGTLVDSTSSTIYEVGTYSTDLAPIGARTLATFERSLESWSSDSYASGNQRIGEEGLRLSPAAGGTLTSDLPGVALDLASYAASDELTMAFHCNEYVSSVRLRLRGMDPNSYFEYSIPSLVIGYNVVSFPFSAFTKTGVLDYSNIDSLQLSVSSNASGSAQVDFDGIRIEPITTDIDNVLVSRSVLDTPIAKGSEMDIEYAIEVSI